MNKQPTNYKTLLILSIALIGYSILLINQAAHAKSPEEACKHPRYNIWKDLQTARLCLLTKRHSQQSNPARFSTITALNVKKLTGFSTRTQIV